MVEKKIRREIDNFVSQVSNLITEEDWDTFNHHVCLLEKELLRLTKEVRRDVDNRSKSTNKKTN